MDKPIDFYGDVNQQRLYALEHLCGLPDFVKKAEIEDADNMKDIPSSSFADPRRRLFPCHTKAAAWLANAYFQLARSQYSKDEQLLIQDRLVKYASFWNIRGLIDLFNKTFAKVASPERPDLQDKDFALVATTDEGYKIRRMPMPNALSVKMAGEYLYANRYSYPYAWRKTAARKILLRAMDYDARAAQGEKIAGAALGALQFESATEAYLTRAAGFGTTHPFKAAEKVAQRVMMLPPKFQDFRVKLAEIAVALRDTEHMTPDGFSKLAAVVDAVDRETGLALHYHQGVDMPEEMFFDVLEKEAAEILDKFITLQTGNSYPVGLFMQLPLEKLAAVLGPEVSASVTSSDGITLDATKFAEIIPTLPRSDAALLERALEELVKSPLEKGAKIRTSANNADWSLESWKEHFKKQGRPVRVNEYSIAVPAFPKA